MLDIIANDQWLSPYAQTITNRHLAYEKKLSEITESYSSLTEFANGHRWFGLTQHATEWIVREWAPNATDIYLIGTFTNWQRKESFRLKPIGNGVWEVRIPKERIHHQDLYKLWVKWDGGEGERIPAYCNRVVQDAQTRIFSAQVWAPQDAYRFEHPQTTHSSSPLLIYECHVGMSSEEEKVSTYIEFAEQVLPRVKALGYNAIQIMAIQEHPYYGSFGYHVSNFFAPSSRFGTPEELKALIDKAHGMGIRVIMDIVHSHAVKNELEGIARLDGSYDLYFPADPQRRNHRAWDSLCFDYGKTDVLRFLLSNCRYWLEEFHFDGFRFDGVTSMIYESHGLEESFTSYDAYFDGRQNEEAICYLTLANTLIHQLNPDAITIAEEVSGMPGLALEVSKGGYGFDYRMAMNIPDYWIKTIKERKDEEWSPSAIWWETTNRRADEKTISYAESHDQALVGDKTIIFRLIDAEMYTHMTKFGESSHMVDRGLALHKMIRLVTSSTINGGYLNFMGNEFGHPEWIDFPREGNGWSHKYARRQWHLADDTTLKYHYLNDFDKEMLSLITQTPQFEQLPLTKVWDNNEDGVLAFTRGDNLLFVFNFHPNKSYQDYGMLVPPGKYTLVLDTDNPAFGGFGLNDASIEHFSEYDELYAKDNKAWLKLYIPARTAMVYQRITE